MARDERQSAREERQAAKDERPQSRAESRSVAPADRPNRQHQQQRTQQVQQQQVRAAAGTAAQQLRRRGADDARPTAEPGASNRATTASRCAPEQRVVGRGQLPAAPGDRQRRELRQPNATPNVMRDRHAGRQRRAASGHAAAAAYGSAAARPQHTGTPTGGTTTATTGTITATITGRSSTWASITIRSAGAISPSRSAGGCGRAITAATTGSTIRGCTACPMRLRDSGPLLERRAAGRHLERQVVDVIPGFFW